MSEGSNQFRGAAFGGFNRQDVLSYLSNATTEHELELSRTQSELEAWKKEATEGRREMEELRGSIREAQKEQATVQEQVEALSQKLEDQEEVLRQRDEELTGLRRELAELAPKALAYERIKERASTIELDAHQRAQAMVDEAKDEVRRMQMEYTGFMQEAQNQYRYLREVLHGAFTRSTVELEQVCQLFDRVSDDFQGYDHMIGELIEQADKLGIIREAEHEPVLL